MHKVISQYQNWRLTLGQYQTEDVMSSSTNGAYTTCSYSWSVQAGDHVTEFIIMVENTKKPFGAICEFSSFKIN